MRLQHTSLFAATLAAAALVLGGVAAAPALAVDGGPRAGFGASGLVLDGAHPALTGRAVLTEPGGTAVVGEGAASAGGGGWQVVRFSATGQPATAFEDSAVLQQDDLVGLARQRDGKILAVGSVGFGTGASPTTAGHVARYTAAGALDTTFGAGTGYVPVSLPASSGGAVSSIALDPDGRIVVAGLGYFASATSSDEVAVRLLADGTPDSTFGNAGVARYPLNGPGYDEDTAFAVAVQPDGKIVLAGVVRGDVSLIRLTADGARDDGFGNHALVVDPIGTGSSIASGVVVTPDGAIVVSGAVQGTHDRALLARFTAAGAVDTGFGTGGALVLGTQLGGVDADDVLSHLAVQPDGKIVAVGLHNVGDASALVIRVTQQGVLDPSFGPGGYLVVHGAAGDTTGYAYDATIGADGNIVVTGGGTHAGTSEPFVARLVGDNVAPARAAFAAIPRTLLAGRTLHWASSDDNTGVAGYQVDVRSASVAAAQLGGWVRWHTIAGASAVFTPGPGHTYCLRVRAVDRAGNAGAYSAEQCLAAPLDDRSLSRHGRWTKLATASAYLHTQVRSSTHGAALSTPVAYRALSLVASTCPTCGTVRVLLGSHRLRTISLHGRTRHEVVFPVASIAGLARGTLHIVITSRRKPVAVDGLVVSQVR